MASRRCENESCEMLDLRYGYGSCPINTDFSSGIDPNLVCPQELGWDAQKIRRACGNHRDGSPEDLEATERGWCLASLAEGSVLHCLIGAPKDLLRCGDYVLGCPGMRVIRAIEDLAEKAARRSTFSFSHP